MGPTMVSALLCTGSCFFNEYVVTLVWIKMAECRACSAERSSHSDETVPAEAEEQGWQPSHLHYRAAWTATRLTGLHGRRESGGARILSCTLADPGKATGPLGN